MPTASPTAFTAPCENDAQTRDQMTTSATPLSNRSRLNCFSCSGSGDPRSLSMARVNQIGTMLVSRTWVDPRWRRPAPCVLGHPVELDGTANKMPIIVGAVIIGLFVLGYFALTLHSVRVRSNERDGI